LIFFSSAPAASKNDTYFKRGKMQLALLI